MIYIIWAPPRKGKTYFATWWALQVLKQIYRGKGNKNKVFSNYPIHSEKYGDTLMWNKQTSNYNITDSLIIIDEAYRDYNSRQYHKFTTKEHHFFATNGHDNNDIILIAHGIHRIDTVILEMADQFYFVKKYKIPFAKNPLFFKIEGYLDEIDISRRYKVDTAYSNTLIRFSKTVAEAYNTHYFRKDSDKEVVFMDWAEYYNIEGGLDNV